MKTLNNKKKYIHLLPVLVIMLFSSCIYEIDYDGDLPEDRFVVTALLEEGSPMSFTVFHSAVPGLYYDYEDDWDDDDGDSGPHWYNLNEYNSFADSSYISVFVNGELKEAAMQTDKAPVKFDYIPKHGDDMLVRIENTKYKTVEQRLKFDMTPLQIDSFNISYQIVSSDNCFVVYLEINDDGGNNYYMLDADFISPSSLMNPKILYESHPEVYFSNNNGMMYSVDDEDKINRFCVFTNEKFKGRKYTLKLAFKQDYYYNPDNSAEEHVFEVRKIDANAYNYLYSLGNYMDAWGMSMNPVTIQDAFTDAYGFISIKKSYKKAVDLSALISGNPFVLH
ncbi:MAG: DUF4249 family protein [Bacteroidales bacterium]|nr:DUF4249 family protein [Bacteroidales bacterium]